jgi:putative addiction module component (TIGR02574 family)
LARRHRARPGVFAYPEITVSHAVIELVDALGRHEQAELIDHIHRSWALQDAALTDEDKRVLDQRMADMDANPAGGIPLEQFISKLPGR